MLTRIVTAIPLAEYRLRIEFSDGVAGVVDLSGELEGEIFAPLRDEALFRQVCVDEYGAVTWPNGADIAPDALYLEIAGREPQSEKPLIAETGSDG